VKLSFDANILQRHKLVCYRRVFLQSMLNKL